jgi:exonuclease III
LPRLRGKASSDSSPATRRVKEDDFGPTSLFSREPIDFDLITQLTHMSAVATSGIARDKLFEGTADLDYSTSKYFRRVHRVAQRLNNDYSQACEIVGDQAKVDSVQNLLLHFATALSAGESEARFLSAQVAGVQIICVYVPNGQVVGSDKYVYKLSWLEQLQRYLEQHCDPEGQGRRFRAVLAVLT